MADARADFGASLGLRQTHGRDVEIAQSLVNLIRLEIREKNFAVADGHTESAGANVITNASSPGTAATCSSRCFETALSMTPVTKLPLDKNRGTASLCGA
jgi:hypothetical protein